ncbi:MAG: DUF1508 domain-containing protein [Acidobacteria bacterium]|nr:DUF1508 domain-containing protein [Acidobacteriota bacterium]
MYFEIYTDTQGHYRWRLKAGNHEIVAQGEGYRNRSDCQHAISLVKQSSNAPVR